MFSNKRIFFILATIIVVFLALRLPLLTKEYAPEEVAWVSSGEGVARTGFLWMYGGEAVDPTGWYGWAFWKTPGFPLVLGLFYKIFGSHEWSSRIVPMLFQLGQLFLIYFLARNIFGKGMGETIGLGAAALLATNPFSVQNSVQVDIDGGPVAFFTLLMFFFAWQILSNPTPHRKHFLGLLLATTGALFFRLDTPTILIGTFSLIFIAFRRDKALPVISTMAGGIILVALVTFGYYALFGQAAKAPAIFLNIINFAKNRLAGGSQDTGTTTYVADVAQKIPLLRYFPLISKLIPSFAFFTIATLWITLPLTALLIFTLWEALKQKQYKEKNAVFLVLPAIGVIAFFTLAGGGANFPRYIQTALNPLYIFIAFWIIRQFKIQEVSKKWLAAGIAALASFTFFTIPFGHHFLFTERPESSPLLAGFATLATIFGASVIALAVKDGRLKNAFALMVASIYIVSTAFLLAHDLTVPYALANYYGNYGFKAAGEYLKIVVKPGEKLWVTDNIGYYYDDKYYNAFGWRKDKDSDTAYIAVYRKLYKRKTGMADGKKLIATFGTVDIYRGIKTAP